MSLEVALGSVDALGRRLAGSYHSACAGTTGAPAGDYGILRAGGVIITSGSPLACIQLLCTFPSFLHFEVGFRMNPEA